MLPSHNHYPLLIEACQLSPDRVKIEYLSSKIEDWDGCISSAYMHGIFPLFHKALRGVESLSPELKAHLKAINFEISRRNMLMSAELLNVVRLLEGSGIQTIAIKGPVLSQIIYGDITQRQFSDLDLLVRPGDMYRAVELLSRHGYESEYPIAFLKNKTLLKIGKDFPTNNLDKDVLIEFHWRLFFERDIQKSTIDLFGDSNYRCRINGVDVETLELGALLVYLLLHGSKHYWERLEWIVDIDRLIRHYPEDIEWDSVVKMAQDMEIEFMVHLGLAMSHELLSTPLPSQVLSSIQSDPHIAKSKETLLQEIRSDSIKIEHSDLVSLENINKIFLMRNRSHGWMRQYFLALFQIKALDVYVVNLPNVLSPLYYVVRFYRIFKQNVLRLK